jgi:hypothetical protein
MLTENPLQLLAQISDIDSDESLGHTKLVFQHGKLRDSSWAFAPAEFCASIWTV